LSDIQQKIPPLGCSALNHLVIYKELLISKCITNWRNILSDQHPLIFGEVLFDCFPDGREVLGGAPFNVAWHLQAFGHRPLFISRVGDDSLGLKIIKSMAAWGMSTDYLQIDRSRPTGQVKITLQEGEPRFAILPNQAYDHISPDFPSLKDSPPFLYHGSLALRDEENQATLATLKRIHGCPVFLDVNLRKPWWSRESVLSMIRGANLLKLNDDECKALFPEQESVEQCGAMLLDSFDLDTVIITQGSKGALALSKGEPLMTIEPTASVTVVDTVGAGDAFSSILLLGFLHKWPLQVTMNRAQDFASAVVGKRGATTEDRTFYQTFSSKWTL